MIPCPDHEQLERLLSEKLGDSEHAAVEAHVEGCAACQQALGEMAGGPGGGEGRPRHPLGTVLLRRLEEALHQPAADAGQAGGSNPATTPQKDFPAPEDCPQVPGYEVLGELGRGGMGVVWKARHVRLNRLVALKMIRAGAQAAPHDLTRFRREAEAVARLQHPNIVQIHEVGEADGQPYLALEFVAGGSLAQKLQGTPLPAREAARLLEVLAQAVQAAHGRGVVHRDLKPANVLLTEDGTPKVTDFGLAKRLDASGAQTQSGAILGTPSYMAPEQAGGKGKDVGPVTDVYALGAILYECLTGRPPFKAETPLDTLLLVQSEEPVPPRRLQPKCPHDLETVCLKCLRKEPKKRYATAQDLGDDLGRFLRGEPIRARPVGPAERAGRWCRRQPVLAGTLATLALALVGGLAGVTSQWWRAERREADAGAARDRAERSFLHSNDMVDDYFTAVSENLLLREQGLQPLRKQLLERALHYYQTFLQERGDDPALRARVAAAHARLGAITNEVGTKADALRSHEAALGLYRQLLAETPDDDGLQAELARSLVAVGRLQHETGRLPDAFTSYEEARGLLEALHARLPDDARAQDVLAQLLNALGRLHYEASRPDDAMRAFEGSLALCEDLARRYPDDPKFQRAVLSTCDGIASQHRENGRPDAALHFYDRARGIGADLVRRHPGLTQFQVALGIAHHNIAIAQMELKQYADAASSYKEARRLQDQLVARNPEVALFRRHLAGTCVGLGHLLAEDKHWDEALELQEEALRLRQKLVEDHGEVPQYHSELSISHVNVGRVHLGAGRLEQALSAFDQARAIQQRLVAENPRVAQFGRELADNHNYVALVHETAGRWEEALAAYERSRQVWHQLVEQNPDNLWYRSSRAQMAAAAGSALAELDRRDEATASFGRGIEDLETVVSRAPAVARYRQALGKSCADLARWQRKWGRPEPAAELARKRRDLRPEDPAELADVGAEFALCIPLVAPGKADLTADEQAQRQRYADEALGALRRAVELGYRDADRLKQDPDFEPLRSREDFKGLLAKLLNGATLP